MLIVSLIVTRTNAYIYILYIYIKSDYTIIQFNILIYIYKVRLDDNTILSSSFQSVSLLSIQIIRNNTIWRSLNRYNVINNVTFGAGVIMQH